MDKKDAYNTLGLGLDAERNDIVKRYNILLKKYKAENAVPQEANAEDSKHELRRITLAYELLMGYIENDTADESSVLCQNLGTAKKIENKKRVENFFYYYKIHLIIAVAILAIVVLFIKDFTSRVTPDLNIVFIGQYYAQDTEKCQQQIKDELGGIKAVSLDVIPLSDNDDNPQEYTYQMKALAIISAGNNDVFIVDKPKMLKYGNKGVFKSLDEYSGDQSASKLIRLKSEASSEEHVYGIDISSSKLMKGLDISGKEFYFAIGAKTEHLGKAVQLLKEFLR